MAINMEYPKAKLLLYARISGDFKDKSFKKNSVSVDSVWNNLKHILQEVYGDKVSISNNGNSASVTYNEYFWGSFLKDEDNNKILFAFKAPFFDTQKPFYSFLTGKEYKTFYQDSDISGLGNIYFPVTIRAMIDKKDDLSNERIGFVYFVACLLYGISNELGYLMLPVNDDGSVGEFSFEFPSENLEDYVYSGVKEFSSSELDSQKVTEQLLALVDEHLPDGLSKFRVKVQILSNSVKITSFPKLSINFSKTVNFYDSGLSFVVNKAEVGVYDFSADIFLRIGEPIVLVTIEALDANDNVLADAYLKIFYTDRAATINKIKKAYFRSYAREFGCINLSKWNVKPFVFSVLEQVAQDRPVYRVSSLWDTIDKGDVVVIFDNDGEFFTLAIIEDFDLENNTIVLDRFLEKYGDNVFISNYIPTNVLVYLNLLSSNKPLVNEQKYSSMSSMVYKYSIHYALWDTEDRVSYISKTSDFVCYIGYLDWKQFLNCLKFSDGASLLEIREAIEKFLIGSIVGEEGFFVPILKNGEASIKSDSLRINTYPISCSCATTYPLTIFENIDGKSDLLLFHPFLILSEDKDKLNKLADRYVVLAKEEKNVSLYGFLCSYLKRYKGVDIFVISDLLKLDKKHFVAG